MTVTISDDRTWAYCTGCTWTIPTLNSLINTADIEAAAERHRCKPEGERR